MSTRAQVCTWMAVCGLVLPSLALAQTRTEREIVELIVRDGPQAAAIRAGSEVVRREQLARLAYPNPRLTYSREGAGFTEFLQVEQAVPWFGARNLLARAGTAMTAAAEAERDAQLWTLRSEAAAAVDRLLVAQTRVQAVQGHTQEVERLIEILRTREREGEGSRFDRLRAEQELQDVRLQVTAASVELGDARASLQALLPRQVPIGVITRSTDPRAAAPPVDLLLARALSRRSELRALIREEERAALESDAARRARMPAPTLVAGVKRADEGSGRARGGVAGLSVAVPLFDTGAREAARWTAERTRLQAERTAAEQQIRGEIAAAVESLALRQAALAGDSAAAADELTRIAEVAYREGEVGILELIDAFRTAARAHTRNLELRRDARLAQIALERAVGDLLWP